MLKKFKILSDTHKNRQKILVLGITLFWLLTLRSAHDTK